MHNNFYFLRQLKAELGPRVTGSVLSECFSQSKDELILRFEVGAQSFFIRANLAPQLSCLSFADVFPRARKNSIDLFPDLVGRRIAGIRQFNNERSFSLKLSDGFDLLFKMHANRTNVILFQNGNVREVFRKNLSGDTNLMLETLDRQIDWSFGNFKAHVHDLKSTYFTFGKVVWTYLNEHGFQSKSDDAKWECIQKLLERLNNPTYYITLIDEKPALSLLETGTVQKTFHSAIEAANEFFYAITSDYVFAKEKSGLIKVLNSKLEAGEAYCRKNSLKLEDVLRDNHYKVWADLIMANLHAVRPGEERVVLSNFYDDNRTLEIRLKKDLTPQKNAEVFYKKAKNQHIEIERLQSSIAQKKGELEAIRQHIANVRAVRDLKELRALSSAILPSSNKKDTTPLPYHEFNFRGFRIWVGKNAQANDQLTFKHGHKDDLWLHAKDVSGSHVLIKYQAGKNFPKDVIEHAASLAAYNSKRKNESLCPVTVTPKKFVRKRKGDPAGAVVVEREEVVLVVPGMSIDS